MLRKLANNLLAKNVNFQSILNRNLTTTISLHDSDKDKKAKPPVVSEENSIVVEKDKNITVIGINRPDKRNAINATTAAKLCQAFSAFEEDETSPVAVLYGIGGSFCSGYDVLELGADDGVEVSIDLLMAPEGSVGPTRRHIKKPVICGINGYCIANGLELALMCDLRIVEESAILGFYNRRFGVPVVDGGTVRLPKLIGLSRAMDLILTGRSVSATEALEMGLANRLVPTGTSLCHAMELAKKLASFPQAALVHDRNSMYSATYEALTFNAAVQNEIMYTSKDMITELTDGIKWFNKNFTNENQFSWLKKEKSMADWDDEEVVQKAAQLEEEKKAKEIARKEEEKNKKQESEKNKKQESEKKKDKQEKVSKESKSN